MCQHTVFVYFSSHKAKSIVCLHVCVYVYVFKVFIIATSHLNCKSTVVIYK